MWPLSRVSEGWPLLKMALFKEDIWGSKDEGGGPFGTRSTFMGRTVAKFIVPDWGEKVNSGIGLTYRPARQPSWRAGTTTLCRSWLYPPQSGTMNSATASISSLSSVEDIVQKLLVGPVQRWDDRIKLFTTREGWPVGLLRPTFSGFGFGTGLN